jgi:hypothetical protein
MSRANPRALASASPTAARYSAWLSMDRIACWTCEICSIIDRSFR